MPDNNKPSQSSLILYQTEDGRTRIQCRFENETIWLTQKLMAELFQKDVRTINEHINNVLLRVSWPREQLSDAPPVVEAVFSCCRDGATAGTPPAQSDVVF